MTEKVDSTPTGVLTRTKRAVAEIIRSSEFGKRQFAIKNDQDVRTVKEKLDSLTPVVTLSSVTGEGLDLLERILFNLPRRRIHEVRTNHEAVFRPEYTLAIQLTTIVFSHVGTEESEAAV